MALSLESSLYVWQKVRNSADALAADPVAVATFKALKEDLATVGGNPDLQFVPINATDVDDASGKVLADVACKLYGVFLKKQATATDAYLVLFDDATDDTGGATDARVSIGLIDSSQQVFAIYPNGISLAAGLVAKSYTDYDGTTDSADTDTPNGFAIIGAA